MPSKKRAPRRPLTFAEVREIALSMPEVVETTAYGMPAFKAGKVRFAGRPVERRDVEPNSLGVPMGFEERARRLAARPDVYYLTEHFAGYPAVLVRLSSIDRAELSEILAAAWQHAMERQGSPKTQPRTKRAPRARGSASTTDVRPEATTVTSAARAASRRRRTP